MRKLIRNIYRNLTSSAPKRPREYRYRFSFPNGQESAVIRERNEREARRFVRDTLELTRLPSGTVVERLD